MIRFYTDHYFSIGRAHFVGGKPCQDYSVSGIYNGSAFAVVSDGCSTGGQTDVGARIVALSTAEAIKRHLALGDEASGEQAIYKINLWQKAVIAGARSMLGLESKDMLATCVYAFMTPDGGYISLQGDGVIAVKDLWGNVYVSKIEWMENMPFYPAYAQNGLNGFITAHGGDLKATRLKREDFHRTQSGSVIETGNSNLSLQEGINGINLFFDPAKMKEIEFIALFSDGVTQIDGIDWKEAVADFLAFKNVTGEFAKRRMIRGVKDSQKKGRGPLDDISYAVIRIEDGKKSEDDGRAAD